ncbi:methyltransferase family protein [Stackebrandtia endophytica]|uniref:Methyltransferase family protein n=1 Tax=Stackebrandtia endophytica TaxID=1496996 RepID=A0A543AQA6_9ACTN|nr:methyltransferase family protein [Stackebrandtia endophytica]
MDEWAWDETLFAGSAAHYGVGRMPYPPSVAEAVAEALGGAGTGRLLDVGCGPGSLTIPLAPLFASAVGIDADPDMLAEAGRLADRAGVSNVEWCHLRAEDLPADLGTFRAVSFGQSFHWMDRDLVACRVRGMLSPDGAWIHVGGTTHRGAVDATHSAPPWHRIDELVTRYLGPVRRAGRGTLPDGTRSGEEIVMRRAGFAGPSRIVVTDDRIVERDIDEVVSAVFSLSSSAPHLFADRLGAFELELRHLLTEATATGRFSERLGPIEVVIWRPT